MRQRPGLRFPIPHLESFPPHIRAALACPLSVDRDGFLSLSLSLTEGNAPPFGPIRGRQRNPPKHCPRPRCPLPGSPFSSRVPPRQAARAGLPVSEDIFRAYPRHAAKLMRNAGLGAEASPQAGGSRRAYPPEARQRFRTISKDGIRLGVPHGNAAKATASCRHFPRLAYPDRRQRPDHAERGRAAYTSQIRGKGRHKRRASARHRHTPQTCGTGGARPHIKEGGRCRPSARPPPAGHPSWARNPPGRLRRPCAALPIP